MKSNKLVPILILLLIVVLINFNQVSRALESGNISVVIYPGTDIETQINFAWEIEYEFWISDNTYDVRISWTTSNIGGNYFDGTYSFSLRIKNVTSFELFAGGGGNIPTDKSQFTKKVDVGILSENFVDETFIQFRIHVDDINKGMQTDDYYVIPITVLGSALHTQTTTVISNNTVSTTISYTTTQKGAYTSTDNITMTINETNTVFQTNVKSDLPLIGYVTIISFIILGIMSRWYVKYWR